MTTASFQFVAKAKHGWPISVNVHLGQPADHQHVVNGRFDLESGFPLKMVVGNFSQHPDAQLQTLGEHVPHPIYPYSHIG